MEKAKTTGPAYWLKNAEIEGLWGHKDHNIAFFKDLNFIIGPNGSGKTTTLKIISSILTGDAAGILEHPFKKASLLLCPLETGSDIEISVQKLNNKSPHSKEVLYSAQRKDDEVVIFSTTVERSIFGPLMGSSLEQQPVQSVAIKSFLENVCKITWLPVSRGYNAPSEGKKTRYYDTVDQRIDDINRRFSEFVNQVNFSVNRARKDFERDMFLTLLNPMKDADIARSIININVKDQKETIYDAFRHLMFEEDDPRYYDYSFRDERIDEFFDKAAQSLSKLKSTTTRINENKFEKQITRGRQQLKKKEDSGKASELKMSDVSNVTSLVQTQEVARLWDDHTEEVRKINGPITSITEHLRNFYNDKYAYVSNSGKIEFYKDYLLGGENEITFLSPFDLSSGEKQIYILLMEAILQSKDYNIYIADEPEISLHVLWQERIAKSLSALSPNSQIIFATHSPDIVGPFQDKVVRVTV